MSTGYEPPSVQRRPVGSTSLGPVVGAEVECITLRAGALRVEVLTYGAHLIGVWAPDRAGRADNLVASLRDADGEPQLARYEDHGANPHLGATVGRYANRIGGARFELDGQVVELVANEGSNQLHGGPVGFDRHVWSASCSADAHHAEATLLHTSPDGDQGFPGQVQAQVRYRLGTDAAMHIDFEGVTSAPTVLNMTNHSYWNLNGTGDPGSCDVGDHVLRVAADRYVMVDASMIPTGVLHRVEGTVFDLRRPVVIGRLIEDPRLATTRGIDHCLVLAAGATDTVAELFDPVSGRRMTLRTDQPGAQVFTANHGVGDVGAHGAICLETQALPDAPNQPKFPSAVLRPGEWYRHRHHLRFSVDP